LPTPGCEGARKKKSCCDCDAALPTKQKFVVGSRVQDRETGETGTVVHVYDDPLIRDEVVAVRFDGSDVPLAVPIDSIRELPRGRS
jgi:hypothetical protein